MGELEREFEEFKACHKFVVVKAALIKFYDDILNTGIMIPSCMQKSVEDLANEHLAMLIESNNLNPVYELCWNKYAECLP